MFGSEADYLARWLGYVVVLNDSCSTAIWKGRSLSDSVYRASRTYGRQEYYKLERTFITDSVSVSWPRSD